MRRWYPLVPLAVFLAALAPGLAAQESRWTVETGTSVVWGESTELVLRDGTYQNPVSRLRWPVGPSLALDLAAAWAWNEVTSTTMAVQLLSPWSRGTMIDEDWDTGPSASDLVYGRSHHTALLTSHWSVDAGQAFRWGPFTASVGLQYRFATWEGWDGEGNYHYVDNVTYPDDSISFSGPIIAFRQQWLIPSAGVAWTFEGSDWSLTPGVRFGPFAWGFDRDDHNYAQNVAPADKQAPLTFLDNVSGGLYGKVSLEAVFRQPETLTWGLRASWQAQWGATGSTTITESLIASSGTHYTFTPQPHSAGSWFQEAALSAFVRN